MKASLQESDSCRIRTMCMAPAACPHLIAAVGESAAKVLGFSRQRVFVAVPEADELVLERLVAEL